MTGACVYHFQQRPLERHFLSSDSSRRQVKAEFVRRKFCIHGPLGTVIGEAAQKATECCSPVPSGSACLGRFKNMETIGLENCERIREKLARQRQLDKLRKFASPLPDGSVKTGSLGRLLTRAAQ
jgi:hypothetical protein